MTIIQWIEILLWSTSPPPLWFPFCFNEVSISFSWVIIVITEEKGRLDSEQGFEKKRWCLVRGGVGGLPAFPCLFFLRGGWCHCQLTLRQHRGSTALRNKDSCGRSGVMLLPRGTEDDFIYCASGSTFCLCHSLIKFIFHEVSGWIVRVTVCCLKRWTQVIHW